MKYTSAIVTGGTSGIGLSIVKHLSKNNYNVFFIGTRIESGKKIEKELAASAKGLIKFIPLDLSDLSAVKQFVIEFRQAHHELGLLLNVAGTLFPKKQLNAHGIEKTFAISYLSAYLLSKELFPLLQNSKNARIINVSTAPKKVLIKMIDFDTIDSSNIYSATDISLKSVHAKTVLTQILSEQFKEFGIAVNAFDPGMVKSNLTRNMPLVFRIVSKVLSVFMNEEAKVGIRACMAQELENVTGKLITKKNEIEISFDQQYIDKLIHYTNQQLSRYD